MAEVMDKFTSAINLQVPMTFWSPSDIEFSCVVFNGQHRTLTPELNFFMLPIDQK